MSLFPVNFEGSVLYKAENCLSARRKHCSEHENLSSLSRCCFHLCEAIAQMGDFPEESIFAYDSVDSVYNEL